MFLCKRIQRCGREMNRGGVPVSQIRWPRFGLFVHQRTCASCPNPLKPRGAAIALKKERDRPSPLASTPLPNPGVVAAIRNYSTAIQGLEP